MQHPFKFMQNIKTRLLQHLESTIWNIQIILLQHPPTNTLLPAARSLPLASCTAISELMRPPSRTSVVGDGPQPGTSGGRLAVATAEQGWASCSRRVLAEASAASGSRLRLLVEQAWSNVVGSNGGKGIRRIRHPTPSIPAGLSVSCIFLSHKISISHQLATNQQYFSLTIN